MNDFTDVITHTAQGDVIEWVPESKGQNIAAFVFMVAFTFLVGLVMYA